MGGNFGSIGFGCESDEEMKEHLALVYTQAQEAGYTEFGPYSIWRSKTGAQVWFFHASPHRSERGLVALTPFFEGNGTHHVHVESTLQRPSYTNFEGAFYGWLHTDPDDEVAAYPIVFDAVNYGLCRNRKLPFDCRVKLVGFVRTILSFADEAAFRNAGVETAGLAPKSFVPIGLLTTTGDGDREDRPPPSSHAMINGEVIEQERLRNEQTGLDFLRLVVTSDGGDYDVLVEPDLVGGDVVRGSYISAVCWMVGRIAGVDP